MPILLLMAYIFFGWLFYTGFTEGEGAERTQVRPTYDYGKSRSFDQQNSSNAHYQESRPDNSYRSATERTQNSYSVESQRAQQKQLNYENRNSYQKGANK